MPTGRAAYVTRWSAAAIGQTQDVRLRATTFSDDHTLSTVYHFLDRAFVAAGSRVEADMLHESLPAGAIIKMSSIPGVATNARLDADFVVQVETL